MYWEWRGRGTWNGYAGLCGQGMVKANEEDTARCSIRRAARALSCGCGGGGGDTVDWRNE